MLYYMVKDDYDGCTKYTENHEHRLRPCGILIGGELYTQNERAKLMNHDGFFIPVEIPKSRVHTLFGARFPDKKPKFTRVSANKEVCVYER